MGTPRTWMLVSLLIQNVESVVLTRNSAGGGGGDDGLAGGRGEHARVIAHSRIVGGTRRRIDGKYTAYSGGARCVIRPLLHLRPVLRLRLLFKMRYIFLACALVAACTSTTKHADQRPVTAGQAAGSLSTDSTPTAAKATDSVAPTTASRDVATPSASSAATEAIANPPIRALYVIRWASQSRKRMAKLIASADSTEINGLVIDMKDEFGLYYNTGNAEFAKN